MQPIALKDPAGFANEFLRLTLLQGFQSLTKRDLELLIFVLLERDGAIQRADSNFSVASHLRVTPAKVKALRRLGTMPIGAVPAMAASTSAHAPAALMRVLA